MGSFRAFRIPRGPTDEARASRRDHTAPPPQDEIDTMIRRTRSAAQLCSLLGILVTIHLAAVPGRAAQWRQDADSFSRGSFVGTEVDSAGSLSLSSFRGANLAFGAGAVAGENTLTGSRSLTDGDPGTEWRFNNKAEVLGQWIQVDLGGDRGVSRVRILPGKTYNQRPLFYLKGYRIEVAAEDTPDDWVLVAQLVDNTHPTVDTTTDSTWIELDASGAPLPVLGRYVRMKIMREDPPNWVSIGEMELYGEGYRASGSFESEVFDAGGPVNVGQVRFAGTTPASTELQVQLRTSTDNETWEAWHRVAEWELAVGDEGVASEDPEPARFLQYRVNMETYNPLRTPTLAWVSVEYDQHLFAAQVTGEITPLRPPLGQETLFTYTLDAAVDAGDLGFDQVRIALPGTVQEVRVDGVALPTDGYASTWNADELRLSLDPDYHVDRTGSLEVDFTGVLLRPTLAVRAGVALGEAANYQNLAPASEDAWTLVGRGIISSTLPPGSVLVQPNPFNAGSGPTRIRIDLAKVQIAQPVSAAIYDLSGRRVRRLWDAQPMTAGRKVLEWDGRSDGGSLVPPGHYLLRVEVDADVEDVWVGLVGVVY